MVELVVMYEVTRNGHRLDVHIPLSHLALGKTFGAELYTVGEAEKCTEIRSTYTYKKITDLVSDKEDSSSIAKSESFIC